MQHRVKWKWGRVKRKRIWEEGVSAVFFVWPPHTKEKFYEHNNKTTATKRTMKEG